MRLLVAALGPALLRLTGRHADGTITWMTGAKTIAEHTAPTLRKAASEAGRPAPRIVCGLPIALVNLLGTAAWMLVFPEGVPFVRWLLTGATGIALVGFLWRVRYHVRAAGYGRAQLSFNPLATTRVKW